MITSIGSTQETLAEILAKLNQTSTESTASVGTQTGKSNALQGTIGDLSIDFQQSLAALLSTNETKTDNEDITSTNDKTDADDNLTARLGAPAGLDLEQDLASQSLTEKLKNMSFMKMFDLDNDGAVTKNDFNVAKEKSPLVQNLADAFEEATDNGGISGFFQNMFNQYKDSPVSLVKDAVEIFA